MKTQALAIQGMSCGHCLNAVNRAISSIPGARAISVRIGRADIEFDENLITPNRIAEVISAAGYPTTPLPS
jgi:copper chaperone